MAWDKFFMEGLQSGLDMAIKKKTLQAEQEFRKYQQDYQNQKMAQDFAAQVAQEKYQQQQLSLEKQKFGLLQEEQQKDLYKLGLTQSNVSPERLEYWRNRSQQAGMPFKYTKMGDKFYKHNPEIAKQQMMIQLAPYAALSGGEGMGAFIKGISGKNVNVGVDTPAEIYARGTELRKEFTNLPVVKDYNLINRQVNAMDSVLNSALKGDQKSKIAVDQALVMLYNKILDPNSVVRESEFARTPAGQGLINRFIGAVQKIEQGGVGLVDIDRKSLVDNAKIIADKVGDTFDETYDAYSDLAKKQAKVPVSNVLRGYKKHKKFINDASDVIPPEIQDIADKLGIKVKSFKIKDKE